MKTIGLLGGMSWESSIEYERLINLAVRKRLGGTSSADLIIRSFNFADLEALQKAGKWDEAGAILAKAAQDLEAAGARAVLICANTMHLVAGQVQDAISIPVLHIADAIGAEAKSKQVSKVLLLGTRYTMEKDFLKGKLASDFGLQVSVPNPEQRDEVHRIIYEELVRGVIDAKSKRYVLDLIDEFTSAGIEGVIAGCTEIELLVKAEDLTLPYFPTAALHAAAAAKFALSN
jgi:aspartate racemase